MLRVVLSLSNIFYLIDRTIYYMSHTIIHANKGVPAKFYTLERINGSAS